MPIKVLLADDSKAIRQAIERHLGTSPEISLVGQATGFEETVRLVNELKPDIVVLDLRMTASVDAQHKGIRQLCNCRTIAISASIDSDAQMLVRKLNADAFIDKMNLYKELIPKILELAGRTS